MYLFDSSAIINLVKRGVVEPFAEAATLDLALYECVNAVWKEHRLLKRIDRETALMFLSVLSDVFRVVRRVSIADSEEDVFKLAAGEGITVYDASYVYAAMRDGLTLVTDDHALADKASKYVDVTSSSELVTARSSGDS